MQTKKELGLIMSDIKTLFDRNKLWSERIRKDNPEFFANLAKQQNPDYLWIGCSDSRVPATDILDLPPGELFVHRNIANLVSNTDMNVLSVIEYAVEILKVEHIIVCGHYGCGGIKAAMDNQIHGLVDNWLCQIRELSQRNSNQLDGLDDKDKLDRLVELNVLEQIANVANSTILQKAWSNGVNVSVHGWIYDMETGLLKDLEKSINLSNFK